MDLDRRDVADRRRNEQQEEDLARKVHIRTTLTKRLNFEPRQSYQVMQERECGTRSAERPRKLAASGSQEVGF